MPSWKRDDPAFRANDRLLMSAWALAPVNLSTDQDFGSLSVGINVEGTVRPGWCGVSGRSCFACLWLYYAGEHSSADLVSAFA